MRYVERGMWSIIQQSFHLFASPGSGTMSSCLNFLPEEFSLRSLPFKIRYVALKVDAKCFFIFMPKSSLVQSRKSPFYDKTLNEPNAK